MHLSHTENGNSGPGTSGGRERSRGSERLEAFSDAVIAIMLTLLSIQLLNADTHEVGRKELTQILLHEWPSFFAFGLTFLVVGQIWITHHNMWRYIRTVDQGLLAINLLLLLFVAIIPFSAKLLSDSMESFSPADRQLAVGVYAATSLGQAISFNFSLWWAKARGLLTDDVDDDFYTAVRKRFLFGPFIYFAALIFSLASPWISLVCYIAVIVLYVVPGPGDLPSHKT